MIFFENLVRYKYINSADDNEEFIAMRKASIELVAPAKVVTLIAGEFGYGKFLYTVDLGAVSEDPPTPSQWFDALEECTRKAQELRYDVSRVRGQHLTLGKNQQR